MLKIVHIVGGGTSWLYLVNEVGRIFDACHQDDAISVARLNARLAKGE